MSTEGHDLPNEVEQLKAMIAQRDAVIESQHNIIEKQLQKLVAQEQRLAQLLRRQYGPHREGIDPDQLTRFSAEDLVDLVNQLEQGMVDSVSSDDNTDDGSPKKTKPKGQDSSAIVRPSQCSRKPLFLRGFLFDMIRQRVAQLQLC